MVSTPNLVSRRQVPRSRRGQLSERFRARGSEMRQCAAPGRNPDATSAQRDESSLVPIHVHLNLTLAGAMRRITE